MFRNPMSSFDRLLEKASSNLLLEPDWASIMAICDSIRGGDTPAKYAVSAIKKKFYHDNPHVQYYALQVMESCVKNCGSLVHDEIATRQFMEELREIVKQTKDDNIKKKVLEMIQHWGMAFRNSPKYRIVTETLNLMKAEGWEFPPVREAEAMFEADVAPEWAEGEVCHRCRTQFGLVTRQHHCRACGQVFCGKCSSKFCVLPKFGIEKEVRVCDSCFDQHGPKETNSASSSPVKGAQGRSPRPSTDSEEYKNSPRAQKAKPEGKTEEEIKEEEELQLAIALSQSEAEAKAQEGKKKNFLPELVNSGPKSQPEIAGKPTGDEEISPELMRYLNRDYWEQKESERADLPEPEPIPSQPSTVIKVSAPAQKVTPAYSAAVPAMQPKMVGLIQGTPPGGRSDEDLDDFVTTLKTQVEIFVNRMKSNSSRGRSIAYDSSVQTLFTNMTTMHSHLLRHIQEQEDKRVHYEGLQDKLTQIKDARAALEALREEERERRRREAEEADRVRQQQMREKLELMRAQKQEYLQYQRQIAYHRMQEQEREMMMRQEQSKQQYSVIRPPGGGPPPMPHGMPMYGAYPGMGMPPQPHGYGPGHMPPQGGAYPDPSMMPQQPHYPGMMSAPHSEPPPPTSSSVGPPPQAQPYNPGEGNAPAPSTASAGHYNMQGMVSALPPSGIMSNPYSPASGGAHQHPHSPYPPMGQQPPGNGAPMPSHHPAMGDQAGPNNPENHQPRAPTEAELICFD